MKTKPLPGMPIDHKTKENAMLNKHFQSFMPSKCLNELFGTKGKPLNLGGNKVKTSRLLRETTKFLGNSVEAMMIKTRSPKKFMKQAF